MNPERRIPVYCPECSLRVSANVHCERRVDDGKDQLDSFGDPNELQTWIQYVFATCPDCDSPFLVIEKLTDVMAVGQLQNLGHQLYPIQSGIRLENVPPSVSKAYSDASQCFKAGLWTPTVVMVRRSVEAILRQESGKKGMIGQLLNELKKSGAIDSHLVDWFEMLQSLGNEAVHDAERSFTKEEAEGCLDFCEAAIEYLYEYRRRYYSYKEKTRKNAAYNDAASSDEKS
jgi:hypothetical protein